MIVEPIAFPALVGARMSRISDRNAGRGEDHPGAI